LDFSALSLSTPSTASRQTFTIKILHISPSTAYQLSNSSLDLTKISLGFHELSVYASSPYSSFLFLAFFVAFFLALTLGDSLYQKLLEFVKEVR